MKKIMMVLGVSVFTFGLNVPVMAEDHGHAHEDAQESTEHYQGDKIETAAQGLEVLKTKVAAIADILKKEGELEFLELEEIHELSYSLENGIDFIVSEKAAAEAQTDAVDEAVQAIHYASENGEEVKTREWFEKLQTAVNALELSEAQNEVVADVAPVKKDFYEIIIKDHKFSPEEIIIPAGEKVKLIVKNEDPTPEEFESHDMNREKIIGGGRKATIFVGPLKPGKYHFFGEFNMDTANGYVIAK